MTSQDEQDLREMQAELVAAATSPWEPSCVAMAFRTADSPFVLTMQAWIDLEAAQSPFLLGKLPEAEEALAHFELAFEVFGHMESTPEACTPEELILIGRKMQRAIARGFSTRVKLAPPEGSKLAGVDNGMGEWLPLLACLKSQLGFSLAEALALRVDQAFALIAAHRINEGWQVAGETYAQREFSDFSFQSSALNTEPLNTDNLSPEGEPHG